MEKPINILKLACEASTLDRLEFELINSGINFTLELVQALGEYEQALHRGSADMIISDYVPSSAVGFSAFEIRQRISPQTPFIVVSGTIGEESAVELIKMGVTDYVLKENMYQLAPKIQRALKEAANRKQKKTALRQLRHREQQLGRIMDLSLDMICIIDHPGRFVTISAACKSILGYLPQELIGKKALDLVHPQDRERTFQAIADVGNGLDLVNFENRYIRKDGREVTLLWTAHWDQQEQLRYCVARDATEIKQAQQKIKNNEKRFRTLLQNSSDGLSLLAADDSVIERSPSSLKLLGYDAAGAPDKLRLDLIHPDELPAVKQVYAQVKANPNLKRTIECRYLMADGSYKWLEVTAHNQLQDPVVGAVVLNYRNITESKTAEIELSTREARLKQAQAIGHMGSWEINWADKSVKWSDEMYRMLGVDKKDITPSLEASAAFTHAEDRPVFFKKFEEISVSLENGSLMHRIVRSDGEIRHVNLVWRFEFDEKGSPACLFGILQDITERKLAEMALQESESKYRHLFNHSPIPMWVYEVETLRFLDVNKAAIEHYGFSKEEFLSMTLKDIRPAEEISRLEQLAQTLKAATQHRDIFRHEKRNGEVIEVDIKSNLIDLGGKKARLVMATDITERNRHIQAIEEQNQRLREIAWTQSHVVRAPLARLMGLTGLIKDYSTEKLNDTHIIDLIQASAYELDGIIREIVRKTEQLNSQPS